MGVASSKKKRGQSAPDVRIHDIEDHSDPIYETPNDVKIHAMSRRDEQVLRILKKDLDETPELFVLNNVLMAVMFFDNYHKDINAALGKVFDPPGTVIKPDFVLDRINKNVRFRPIHGNKKQFSETIAPRRIYPLMENVVVEDLSSKQQNQDAEVSKFISEDSSRKGYVKLKDASSDDIRDKSSSLVIKEIPPTPSTSSSTDNESDTNYAYATITNLKTPKPIEIIEELQNSSNPIKACCDYCQVERTDRPDEPITEEDLYEKIPYLNARRFMHYFANNVFPSSMGKALGFDQNVIASAETIPGKLFCSITEKKSAYVPCEILPSVRIPWPEIQTYLWQGNVANSQSSWPNAAMVRKIKTFECVLVPKGYFKKRGRYPEGDLEWEIHFPLAESYLESCMSHAQIKCFAFLLALHKSYIEDVTRQQGLLVEHIRTHMFWECADNYNNWPEHRLGTKMIGVLNNLLSKIRKGKLYDFFVRDKNLFKDVPTMYLHHSNKTFHDVLQAPLMYFMKALRNVRYTSGKFYPPIDFKELNRIVTGKSLVTNNSPKRTPNLRVKIYEDTETQHRHLKEIEARKRIWEKREKIENDLKNLEDRRGSVDSINVDWDCEKEFDFYKKRRILRFFRDLFWGIAKKSSKIGSNRQTLFYLKQAWYLETILETDCAVLGDNGQDIMSQINRDIALCNNSEDESDVLKIEKPEINLHVSNPDVSEKPRKSVAFIISQQNTNLSD